MFKTNQLFSFKWGLLPFINIGSQFHIWNVWILFKYEKWKSIRKLFERILALQYKKISIRSISSLCNFRITFSGFPCRYFVPCCTLVQQLLHRKIMLLQSRTLLLTVFLWKAALCILQKDGTHRNRFSIENLNKEWLM